eukprot:m.199309 g.199309  ORF g.199309 m.199309 type:complete len:85 (+) comp39567_c0_seq43:1434-1688(+)
MEKSTQKSLKLTSNFKSLKEIVRYLESLLKHPRPEEDDFADVKVRDARIAQDALFYAARQRFDPFRLMKERVLLRMNVYLQDFN